MKMLDLINKAAAYNAAADKLTEITGCSRLTYHIFDIKKLMRFSAAVGHDFDIMSTNTKKISEDDVLDILGLPEFKQSNDCDELVYLRTYALIVHSELSQYQQ